MPGSKHIGDNDEVITSKKLNHMEYGLEKASTKKRGGALIVHEIYGYNQDLDADVCTLDTTFMDMFNAANNGSNIYIVAYSAHNERIIFKVAYIYYNIGTNTSTSESHFSYSLYAECVSNYFDDYTISYSLIIDDSSSFPKNGPNSYPYRYDTRIYAVEAD